MNYKVEKVIKNFKKSIAIYIIIWLTLTILFVAPVAYSIVEASPNGVYSSARFLECVVPEISGFTSITKVFGAQYINTFFRAEMTFTVVFTVFMIVGLFKSAPKNEYADIEHGSSDWSENGEQYKILSKNKGIILAQDNYLPVNKRGNVNVLVVGRIWFW